MPVDVALEVNHVKYICRSYITFIHLFPYMFLHVHYNKWVLWMWRGMLRELAAAINVLSKVWQSCRFCFVFGTFEISFYGSWSSLNLSPQIGCSMYGFRKNVGVVKIILSNLRGGHLKEFRSMFLVLFRLCSIVLVKSAA